MEIKLPEETLRSTFLVYCGGNSAGRQTSLKNLQRLFRNIAGQIRGANRDVLTVTKSEGSACPSCNTTAGEHLISIKLK